MASESNAELDALIAHLRSQYEGWRSEHALLERCFSSLEGCPIIRVMEVLRETFFANNVDKGLRENDPRLVLEAFKNMAFAVVGNLQQDALEAFKAGKNPKAYTLLVTPTDIGWSEWRDGMEEQIEDQVKPLAH